MLDKTVSDVLLPNSRIWEEVYPSKESESDQLHFAWWANPGDGNGCLAFDELEEAFEQFLLQVCHRVNFCITTTTIDTASSRHDRKQTFGQSKDWLSLSEETGYPR